jgi:murein DD-endopeptidase MepM/ murein hydrolase activator NlpD
VRIADCGLRNKSIYIVLSIFVCLVLGNDSLAAEQAILISPKKIVPGGLMVVTVKTVAGAVEGTFRGKQLHFNKAKTGFKAVTGIDLNTEPGGYPLELAVDGKTLTREVAIAKKKYRVQRLTLPEDKVILSPEDEARADREQKKMSALWPIDSDRFWSGRFTDPLPGKEITTPFGVRRIINSIPKNPHSGIDLAANVGEPVRAPNDGVVVLAEDQFFSGNSIVLDHGQGIYTMFFHLSEMRVRIGQAVIQGDVIGLVGATGRLTGPCLHWGVRVQGAKVDPLELIKLKRD